MLSFQAGLKITAAALIAQAVFAQEIIRSGQPRGQAPEPLTALNNGYIVTFAPGTPKATRALVALQAGAQVRHNYDNVDAISVTAPNSNSVNALRSNPAVRRVTPDWMHHGRVKPGSGGGGGTATVLPLDTLQMVSYEVQRIGIPQTDSDGTGIGVALLDSGIDFAHPDLVPALSATSYNAFTPGASCQDDGGHGTHLAGLIAAQNNSIAIVGVAPGARLYCVTVLDSTISGADSIITAGLDWVLQNHSNVNPPIRVVNVSFGRPLDS